MKLIQNSDFNNYIEKTIADCGGNIVHCKFSYGELNGFILPVRTKTKKFWEEQLFTPYGLACLFNIKNKSNNCK